MLPDRPQNSWSFYIPDILLQEKKWTGKEKPIELLEHETRTGAGNQLNGQF